MVTHTYDNPSTPEAEAGKMEFQASLGYTEKPCLKRKSESSYKLSFKNFYISLLFLFSLLLLLVLFYFPCCAGN
jgi:hypothetical protein